MAVRAALLAAAVLLAAAPAARACAGVMVRVYDASSKPAGPLADDAYNADGVRQHIETLLPITDLWRNTQSTFSCVDARGETPQLGTPGGDMAELAAAVTVYLKMTNSSSFTDAGIATIKDVFAAFMDQVITPERPFYLHTSDEKLHKVFAAVKAAGVSPKPVSFPEMKPNGATGDLWVNTLANGSLQGCGHMRLMVEKAEEYGLESALIPQTLIKEFYNYWWPTPPGSPQRAKVSWPVLQGPLNGEAIAVVDTVGSCPGLSAPITPSHGGSQIFVYHPTAVSDFRQKTLTPFFVNYGKSQGKAISPEVFYALLKNLQRKDLGETLTFLPPANAVNLYSVSITVEDDGSTDASLKAGGAADAAIPAIKNVPLPKNAPAIPKNAANAANAVNAAAAPRNAAAPNAAKNSGRRMMAA